MTRFPRPNPRDVASVLLVLATVGLVIFLVVQQQRAIERVATQYESLHADYELLYQEALAAGADPEAPAPDDVAENPAAVPVAIPGPSGAPGRDGKDGRDGIDGKDGEPGTPGANGTNGLDGVDGVDGEDGVDGQPGKDGADGLNGADGKDGQDGATGDIGPPGTTCSDGSPATRGQILMRTDDTSMPKWAPAEICVLPTEGG